MAKRKEWFEKFFAGLYGEVLACQFTPEETRRQARTVKRVLGLKRGARVLDIPCGMGRLTLPLAQMGFEMTGVDLTESYVRRARREAKKAGARIRYRTGDMREIEFDGEFDAAVNWFTSFGYFSDEDNLSFLKKARQALRPGGKLLIETMNKTWVVANWQARGVREYAGVRVVNTARFDRRTDRIINIWKFSKGRRRETQTLVLRVFDAGSMRRMLREAGFRDVRIYGTDFRSNGVRRMTGKARRMISVATKR